MVKIIVTGSDGRFEKILEKLNNKLILKIDNLIFFQFSQLQKSKNLNQPIFFIWLDYPGQ